MHSVVKFMDAAILQAKEGGSSEIFVDCCLGVITADGANKAAALAQLKDLFAKSTKRVNALITEHSKDEVSVELTSLDGDVFLELPDAQFFEPRGRFKTQVSTLGLHLTGKSAACFVPWTKVTHAVVVPASQTTKKEGEDYLCMRLEPESVQYNGKTLKNVLWNLGKSLGKPIKVQHGNFDVGGTESEVVQALLTHLRGCDVTRPNPTLFQTVSQTASKDAKPYLRCYKGTQEGAIYPLECGVVFVKPIMFLPAEEIAAITAGRGGGSGQTRYVDLKLEMDDESEVEFTNIEREELPAMQAYVKGFLECRAAEAEKVKAEERAARGDNGADDDDDDSEEDDDDFDPDASNSNADSDNSETDSSDDDEDDSYTSEGGADSETDDDDDAGNIGNSGKGDASPSPHKVKKVKSADKAKSPSKSRKHAVRVDLPKDVEEEDVEALMRAAYQSSKAKRAYDDVVPTAQGISAAEGGSTGSEVKRPKVEM